MPLLTTENRTFKAVTKSVAVLCASALMMGALTSTTFADKMDDVLAGDHRSDRNKSRDKYRHPKETLAFFGLTPEMAVVEISPGGGWYQEILAPYLHDKGTYYSAGSDLSATSGRAFRTNQYQAAKITKYPALYGKIVVTELALPHKTTLAPAGTADMVLSFRNFHNWEGRKQEKDVLKAVFAALKPGGIFGITDHRDENGSGSNGYVKPSYVIEVAESVGFVLVARSEINGNAKDNHNHEKGVWTLPPSLSGNKANHEAMKAIGESDRLTIKFMKPKK